MIPPIEVVIGKDNVVPAPQSGTTTYSPSKIVLYGVTLSRLEACLGGVNAPSTSVVVNVNTVNMSVQPPWFTALIYAYAYQAHCYYLPEPTLLTLPYLAPPVAAAGFGFDGTAFQMWKVEKLDRAMQLEMTSDTFEELLLKRGLQGTKQPLSYASRASISHRGGSLSE
jgi:hypothetical protein